MLLEKINTSDSELILKLSGEMDALNCATIRDDLDDVAADSHTHVSLDMNNVDFLDSSGIGVIVFLFKRLKEQNRSLKIIGAQGQPHELMVLLHINSAIPVELATTKEQLQAM